MNIFEKREKKEEGSFSYSQELEFKISSRRARLMGLWAAEKMGIKDAEAELYAKALVAHDLTEPGINDLLSKVKADFLTHSIEISDHRIEVEAQRLYEIAKEQILAGK